MSSIAETKPTQQAIRNQDTKKWNVSRQRGDHASDKMDGIEGSDKNGRKSLNFTQRSFDAAKSSSEHRRQSEEIFTTNQTDTTLCTLRTFARPNGLKITSCIFRRDLVEICYLFEGTSDHNKDELRTHLADHLKIDSKLIKMTKLRAKPIYKETTLSPGETATIHPQGSCKIGAFVEVEGKGIHALMSGHGKSQGDVLRYPNGDRVGTVGVSLHPPLQPTANDNNWCCYYKDVALVRLEEQDRYIAQVLDDDHSPLRLMEQPIDATNGMMVRRFTENGRRGKVDSAAYNIWDDTYNIAFRLISVVSEDGGPIHDEGDSGILIVTDTPVDGKVKAVGILVRLEQMEEENEEQRVRITSLAVPLQANFEALRNHPYCNGATITFLN